ncbi:MAG: hypothetical protein OXI38_08985, partial [Bacteroidota bacterium]|nr:hypothetical protein [Bacteroidota bacterium]
HVRFCGGLGVQFPRATRRLEDGLVAAGRRLGVTAAGGPLHARHLMPQMRSEADRSRNLWLC